MSAPPRQCVSVEEYFRLDRAAETKSEYFNGEMFPRGEGPTPLPDNPLAHAVILANLSSELRAALRHKGFAVGTKLDGVVEGVAAPPDITVLDPSGNPVLFAEVLSPATAGYDAGTKAARYRRVASLREYAFVSQSEPLVEVYTRQNSGWLLSEFAGLEAICRFPGMECEIPL